MKLPPHPDKALIAPALRKLRKKAGLIQKDIAEAIGVARSRYNEMEQGHAHPTLDQIYYLKHFYRQQKIPVDFNALLEDTPPIPKDEISRLNREISLQEKLITHLEARLIDNT